MSRPILEDPTYQEVQEHWLEHNGAAAHHNYFLKLALAGSIVLNLLLGVGILYTAHWTMKKARQLLVVRVDEIGRAQVLGKSDFEYKPQPLEAKYFLTRYFTEHYARIRARIADDYVDSLNFLSAELADPELQKLREQPNWITKFKTGEADENDIQVDNIVITDFAAQPYKAEIAFEKIFRNRAGAETRRERWVSTVRFVIEPIHDNQLVAVNPIGLRITDIHDDQAFQ